MNQNLFEMPSAQVSNISSAHNPLKDGIEIIKDRLYYAAYDAHPSTFPRMPHKSMNGKTNRPIHYFSIDNELVYWNFFLDFGPLNLSQLYRFCSKLNYKLNEDPNLAHKTIVYFSGSHPNKRANAVFLICAWQILYMNKTPEEVLNTFTAVSKQYIATLPPFHDASPYRCTYQLTVLDCLRGLVKARMYGFFDFAQFDAEEYEYFEQVENGDLNWIVKDRFLAFAGPHMQQEMLREGYHTLTPEFYIPYFLRKNVGLVVRLNKKQYDENKFKQVGIKHSEHYYLDGSCPPMKTLQKVIASFESIPHDKGIAVHCKAGLGRTGTCIGAYIMKHYKFTAAEIIGWMRICRPGMVIGPQQHFLEQIQQQMWLEGNLMNTTIETPLNIISSDEDENLEDNKGRTRKQFNIISKLPFDSLSVNEQIDHINGQPGQAEELLVRRMQHAHC